MGRKKHEQQQIGQLGQVDPVKFVSNFFVVFFVLKNVFNSINKLNRCWSEKKNRKKIIMRCYDGIKK